MTYENILVETDGGVGVIRLNRPKALNALNDALIAKLGAALDAFEADANIGCIVITGSEKAFAAGADIKEMSTKTYVEVFTEDFFGPLNDAFRRARKPIIAAVSGFALGGGCELAMMCDFIIAADTAKFGQPEINLGSSPGSAAPIAAAQGIALSRNVWCAGWSSLAAPDVESGPSYRVIGDARRQSFYLAEVKNARLMPEVETVSPEIARERCADGSAWLTFDPQVPLGLPQVIHTRPNAVRLAQIVAALPEAELRELIAPPLIPHYLAEAFITKPKRPPGTV